ncbi:hypothetical protein VTN77DRAFT_2943 [Rasamsonia byssochlamydoides]|uniref:uncharacterized protein n=1 Tax=Rasamsonia byssochlamydoides TaxID=89139 RepID=UPI0037430863
MRRHFPKEITGVSRGSHMQLPLATTAHRIRPLPYAIIISYRTRKIHRASAEKGQRPWKIQRPEHHLGDRWAACRTKVWKPSLFWKPTVIACRYPGVQGQWLAALAT